MDYEENRNIEDAIEALFSVARDNQLLGYGSLPPLEMRITAARGIATYMPHRKAIEALTYLMNQHHAPEEIRIVATEGLARK